MPAPVWTPRDAQTITSSLGGLPASSTLVVGRCTSSYDNTVNNDPALVLSGFFRTAGANLSTAGLIQVWAFTQRNGTDWPDLFTSAYTGSAGDFTVRSANVLNAGAFNIATITTNADANRTYDIRKRDVVAPFRGVDRVAFFITHSTHTGTNAWDGTNTNHQLIITPYRWV